MKPSILLLLFFLILTSCATIFTRRQYTFRIDSDSKDSQVKIYDSIYPLPAKIKVTRSKTDLDLLLINDTIKKTFIVKPRLNPHFLYGNLAWSLAIPVAYAVDLTSQKRFYYGKKAILSFSDTSGIINPGQKFTDFFTRAKTTSHSRKGEVFFHFAMPSFGHVYKISEHEPWYFGGIQIPTVGWEYNFMDNKFLDLTVGNIFTGVTLAETFETGDKYDESASTLFFDLTMNRRYTRFSLGSGINYSWDHHTWEIYHLDTLTMIQHDRYYWDNTHSLGLVVNGFYQLGKYFYFGLVYRPSVLTLYPLARLQYQHSISLELRWRFPLRDRSLNTVSVQGAGTPPCSLQYL